MAKPIGSQAGSGMHVHVSLLDREGRNVFSSDHGELLGNAIGGCLTHLAESHLLFAPHANSYRRFVPQGLAPTAPTWGHDNRIAALRVPSAPDQARRFEHRVPGADTNPYLVIAAILAAALDGIDHETKPGPATIGDAASTTSAVDALPLSWAGSIDRFSRSPWIEKVLGGEFQRVLTACKRQEHEHFRRRVPDVEYETYLGVL
jgi:glutamine synthetase